MLSLKQAQVDEEGVIVSTYEVRHSNPGRQGTTLRLELQLRHDPRFGSMCARSVLEPELDGGGPEEVLDKLADWAERLALAIRHRGPASALVPLYRSPVPAPAAQRSSAAAAQDD